MNKIIKKFGWTGSLFVLGIIVAIIISVVIRQIQNDKIANSKNEQELISEKEKVDKELIQNNELSTVEDKSIFEKEKANKDLKDKKELSTGENEITSEKEKVEKDLKDNKELLILEETKDIKKQQVENKDFLNEEKSFQKKSSNISDIGVKLKKEKDINISSKKDVQNNNLDQEVNSKNSKIKPLEKKLEEKLENTKVLNKKEKNENIPNNNIDQSITIDIFRIDENGNYLIAGKTFPFSEVKVLSNELEIASTISEEDGNFVIMGEIENDTDPKQIQILTSNNKIDKEKKDIEWLLSKEIFHILPKNSNQDDLQKQKINFQPTIVKSSEKITEILQKSVIGNVDEVSLDLISYNESGNVILSGRAGNTNLIYVYLNNKFIQSTNVSTSGGWKIELLNISPGIYDLRIDETSKTGKVISRLLIPFKKESTKLLTNLVSGTVTVQSGNSLWRIARRILGKGIKYIEIYEKNKNQIKNPNLIYPGQVFIIPN